MAKLELYTDPRITTYESGFPLTAKVTLSERNLLVLLSKLYTDGSACTLVNNDVLEDGEQAGGYFAVSAQKDDVHYIDRPPPGEMHPLAEAVVRKLQAELGGE